ncbi:beta strand repeat-containing protein [Zavarzinella formosa]|uniref:beta strand repeat-containing protein n=1 Tax=Zavarzinella formosa TaxID=360055 RepID=UPI000314C3D4|nr:PKD domain-containing protein [Zavarzinella formosa]
MRRSTSLTVTALENREVMTGDLVYALQLTGLPADSFVRIAADPAGNSYVTGTFTGTVDLNPSSTAAFNVTSKGGTDVFVAKYGYSGQLLWADTLGGTGNDTVSDITFDGAGNSYITGSFNGTVDFNPAAATAGNLTASSGGSAYLWKLGYNGGLVYANMVGGKSTASSVTVDPLGNAVVTGQFFGTADFNPSATVTNNLTTTNVAGAGFIWKTYNTGLYAWARDIQSAGGISLTSVAIDGAGNVIAGGQFNGLADFDPSATTKFNINGGSFWTPAVVKLNSAGNFLWAKSAAVVTGSVSAVNNIVGVQLDSQGNVYAAGNFGGAVDFDPGTAVSKLTSIGGTDGFVWKLSSAGNLLFGDRFGTAADDKVTDLGMDKAGNTYTIGQFTGAGDFDPGTTVANLFAGSGTNTFILKLSTTGALRTARTLGNGNGTTNATGIWADGAGNVYAAGTFAGTVDFDPSAGTSTQTTATSAGFVAKIYTPATAAAKPPNNTPINVSAGGPYTINEGAAFSPKATAVDPDANALTYSWDLNGDGIYGDATGAAPVVTAAKMASLGLGDSRGTPWNVRVQVSDGVNIPVVASTTLTINNVAPTAKFAPLLGTAFEGIGTSVSFTSPADPSVGDTKAGFRYSFDLNGDGKFDIGNGASFAGSVTTATAALKGAFAESGSVLVLGRIFDRDGGYRDYTVRVNFLNLPPTATFTSVGVQTVGTPITFRFTNVKDISPGDTAAGFRYSFDWNNDGVFDQTGTAATATHVFQGPGTYKVRGRVIDRDGGFSDGLLTLVIK